MIADVRGLGLMVATEVADADGRPDGALAARVLAEAEAQGLLLICGPHANVVRWIPPLVVEQEQIDEAVDRYAEALTKATAG